MGTRRKEGHLPSDPYVDKVESVVSEPLNNVTDGNGQARKNSSQLPVWAAML